MRANSSKDAHRESSKKYNTDAFSKERDEGAGFYLQKNNADMACLVKGGSEEVKKWGSGNSSLWNLGIG